MKRFFRVPLVLASMLLLAACVCPRAKPDLAPQPVESPTAAISAKNPITRTAPKVLARERATENQDLKIRIGYVFFAGGGSAVMMLEDGKLTFKVGEELKFRRGVSRGQLAELAVVVADLQDLGWAGFYVEPMMLDGAMLVCSITTPEGEIFGFEGMNASPPGVHTLLEALDAVAGKPLLSRSWPKDGPVGLRFESWEAMGRAADDGTLEKLMEDYKSKSRGPATD